MQKLRLAPVVLACAAFTALVGQAHAQDTSSLNLVNNASLSSGMSTTGVRTYEQLKSAVVTNGVGGTLATPSAAIGAGISTTTNGATNQAGANGSANGSGSTIGTTSNGNGQYAYNSNGQLVSTGASTGGFVGPMQPNGSVIGAVPGSVIGATAGTAAGGVDWLKLVQVAAPVVASITGNQNIANVASMAGSGAQIYGQVSSGQELTMQNYANMGNIALQTAALATKNTNIDKAAQLGNIGVGAWNAYSVLSPGATTATQGVAQGQAIQGQVVQGQVVQGQPLFQAGAQQGGITAVGAATSTWGVPATAATGGVSGASTQSVDNYDLQGPSFVTSPRYDNSADSHDLQG